MKYSEYGLFFESQMVMGVLSEAHHLVSLMRSGELTPPERAAVGRALAELGDPRPGVGVSPDSVPEIYWVDIPAGEFVYQEGDRLQMPSFCIARYPITYLQFQAFVEAEDGFADERWWEGLVVREPKPDEQPCPYANHPRENVSWCAAVAFCRWLSAQLGEQVRLPTEEEWERVTRGPEGRTYPWGETYLSGSANLAEVAGRAGQYEINRTTAVGIYPEGETAEGVLDLIGNVWEWCLNEFWDAENIGVEGDARRVMRGGSWSCSPREVSALSRELDLPDYGYAGVGFRVVRGAQPHP